MHKENLSPGLGACLKWWAPANKNMSLSSNLSTTKKKFNENSIGIGNSSNNTLLTIQHMTYDSTYIKCSEKGNFTEIERRLVVGWSWEQQKVLMQRNMKNFLSITGFGECFKTHILTKQSWAEHLKWASFMCINYISTKSLKTKFYK
jgi:hypothetical protein